MALLESDAFPIKEGWMNKMYQKAFYEGSYLLKGTAYNNKFRQVRKWYFVHGHINGNCLWNVTNHDFLLKSFKGLEEAAAAIGHHVGYDVLFNLLYIHKNTSDCRFSYMKEYCEFCVDYIKEKQLKDYWTSGYIDTPYIYNTMTLKRTLCYKMKGWSMNLLNKWFKDNLFVHCTFHRD